MLITFLVIGGATAVAAMLFTEVSDVERGSTGSPGPDPEERTYPDNTGDAGDAGDADEMRVDQNLAIAGGALALNVVGAIVAPPIALLSAIPLVVVTAPFLRRAYRMRGDPDRRWVALIDSLSLGGCLVTGHFFACALGSTLVYGSMKGLRHTRRQTHEDLAHVFGEQPSHAWLVQGGVDVEVPLSDLVEGDQVVVRAGNAVPVDGIVVEGEGAVDERALTGESTPAAKKVGDRVFASTLAIEGPLLVEVTQMGADTTVGQLHAILQSTEDLTEHYRSVGETLVERGALPTLALSALTLPLLGVTSALAMTFASFGYHMRTAAPISVLGFINLAAQQGVLIKDGRALELLAAVDTVLFDKTGTLTTDKPEVVCVHPLAGYDAAEVLRIAASTERGQTHPIAHAILAAAAAENIETMPVERLEVSLGAGLRARVNGDEVRVGSERLMVRDGVKLPPEVPPTSPESAPIYVAVNGQVVGLIELATPIRREAGEVIAALRARGLDIGLVSGDREEPARRLAEQLGITRVHAEVLPEEKSAIVAALQAEGRRVCFVGDGINDAIALKAADVSISLSGASAAATDTAALVMLDGNLTRLPDLFAMGGDFRRNLERGKVLTIAPGVLCVGGIYLVHAGVAAAIMLYNVALASSVANALQPTIQILSSRADNVPSPSRVAPGETDGEVRSND